ncbi:MAG: SctK family type III secretion system sorting platform protein [Gammaproteobacteria bacterium]|nr:SctK family type III secretion system sorting platform protein [Gammaproteobacteria bacterium]
MASNVRFELQAAAMSDLHPSWAPTLAPELVLAARERAIGRRWLARQITASELLGNVTPITLSGGWRWLLKPLSEFSDLLLDLGGIVLAPRLRTVVERKPLALLREVLGEARYQRVLKHGGGSAAPLVGDAAAALPDDAEGLREVLRRQAAIELQAQLQGIDRALSERLALALPRDWALPPSTAARLDAAVFEAVLRTHVDGPLGVSA